MPTARQSMQRLKRCAEPALPAWPRLLTSLALACLAFAATALVTWAAPGPPPRHTVQPGDTLAAIAQQYGSTAQAITAANLLADPDQIAPGQVLAVPPAAAPLLRIEVRPREALIEIARRYGVRPAELLAINGLARAQKLLPGQDMLVPPPAGQPSPALPPGPIVDIVTSPAVLRQGETLSVRVYVDASRPVSVSVQLEPQSVTLRRAADGALWGLVAVHALTEPGYAWLDVTWQAAGQPISATVRWPIQVVDAGYPTYDIVLPPGKGDLLAPELVQAELERMMALWNAPQTPPVWRRLFLRPVDDQYRTSAPYGQRRSYNSGPVSGFHAGQDFAAPEGAPVVAPAAGKVVLAEPLVVRGNAVLIDHGGGVFSGYWHLVDIAVSAGQQVQPGDLLGHVGTTGLSTGNHLHWELRVNGFAVDPMQWLVTRFP